MNDATNIEQMLGSDEQLLWSGTPVKHMFLGPWDVVLLLFDIVWLSLVSHGIYHAINMGNLGMLVLLGMFFAIPFLQSGVKRFVGVMSRRRTEYAVTNHRILIRSGYPTTRFKSLDLDTTKHVGLFALGAGLGAVVFDPQPMPQIPNNVRSMLRTSIGFNPIASPSFLMIEDAEEVHRIIIEAKEALRSGHGGDHHP